MEETAKPKGLLKQAMEMGAYFGLFLLVKFLLATQSLNNPFLNLASLLMLFAIPFVVYYLMRRFKKTITETNVFSQLWMFGILLFFFASLISCLGEYIYYVYIDPSYLNTQITAMLAMLDDMEQLKGNETLNMMKDAMANGATPTPSAMIMQTIWANTFVGSLLSILLALILNNTRQKSGFNKEN